MLSDAVGEKVVRNGGLPVLAVVGNGMVGHHFCDKLAELKVTQRFQVIVFGEEPRVAYDRVHRNARSATRPRDLHEVRETESSGRRPLPPELPPETVTPKPTETGCPDCGGALGALGEDVSEMLAYTSSVRPGNPRGASGAELHVL
jgi:hypothetical protein